MRRITSRIMGAPVPKLCRGTNTCFLFPITGTPPGAYLGPGDDLPVNHKTFRNGVLGQHICGHFPLSFRAFVMILDACADAGARSRVSVRRRHTGVSGCGWGEGGTGLWVQFNWHPGGYRVFHEDRKSVV